MSKGVRQTDKQIDRLFTDRQIDRLFTDKQDRQTGTQAGRSTDYLQTDLTYRQTGRQIDRLFTDRQIDRPFTDRQADRQTDR